MSFGLLPSKIIPLTQLFKVWSSETVKVNFLAWLTMIKYIQTQENQRFRHFLLNSHAKKLVFWPVTCQNDPLNPLFQSMVQCNNWFEVLNMVKKHESLCKKRKFRIRSNPCGIRSKDFSFSWPKLTVTCQSSPPYLVYQCHMEENTKIQIMIMVTIHWGSIDYCIKTHLQKSGFPM